MLQSIFRVCILFFTFEPQSANKFKMLKIKVNEAHEYEVDINGEVFTLNNEEHQPDFVKISETEYHLLLKNKSYRLFLNEQTDDKHLSVEVNGNLYTLAVKDGFDILLDKLGMNYSAGLQAKDVKAPMPGLVVDILVAPGDEVSKDSPLLILEAMKMENILKSPGTGIIDKILVNKKDAVEKGQVLIAFK